MSPIQAAQLSYAAVFRLLMKHLRDLPAIIEAVNAIRNAMDLREIVEGTKHLIDLLEPIAADLIEAIGSAPPEAYGVGGGEGVAEAAAMTDGVSEMCAAATPEDQTLCAEAGIDWQKLIDALPAIVATLKTLLLLFAKK